MNRKVLFVDDDQNVLAAYHRNLCKHYDLDVALGGPQGLQAIQKHGPYAVVIADMQMPKMNGIQFLQELEKEAPDTIRLMLTGNADQKTAMDAVNQGHVFRFLTKPCPPYDLAMAVNAGLRQYQLVNAERDLLEKTLKGGVNVLVELLSILDPDSFGRAQEVAELAQKLGRILRLESPWMLGLGAMLAKIGVVTVPPAIIAKERMGKPILPEERELLNRIPEIGSRLLRNIPRLEEVAEMIRYSEKHFNGSGYPFDELKGEDLPPGSRILHVASDFMNLYLRRKSKTVILEHMRMMGGTYDPKVLEALGDLIRQDTDIGVPEVQTRSIAVNLLTVGMELAEDVLTADGLLLVPASTRLTQSHIEKLINFKALVGIRESIKVLS